MFLFLSLFCVFSCLLLIFEGWLSMLAMQVFMFGGWLSILDMHVFIFSWWLFMFNMKFFICSLSQFICTMWQFVYYTIYNLDMLLFMFNMPLYWSISGVTCYFSLFLLLFHIFQSCPSTTTLQHTVAHTTPTSLSKQTRARLEVYRNRNGNTAARINRASGESIGTKLGESCHHNTQLRLKFES